MIMPVEYVYEDGVIIFRTEHDTKLHAAVHGAVLAFEVDAFDPGSGIGWSVHVLGRATVVTADHDVAPLPTLDDEHPEEPRRHYVRLHCEIVNGRRLAFLATTSRFTSLLTGASPRCDATHVVKLGRNPDSRPARAPLRSDRLRLGRHRGARPRSRRERRPRSSWSSLCEAGVDVAVVSGTHVGNVDGQLRARPAVPGRLLLALNRGSELFEVGADGPVLVARRDATRRRRRRAHRAAARHGRRGWRHGVSRRGSSRSDSTGARST